MGMGTGLAFVRRVGRRRVRRAAREEEVVEECIAVVSWVVIGPAITVDALFLRPGGERGLKE